MASKDRRVRFGYAQGIQTNSTHGSNVQANSVLANSVQANSASAVRTTRFGITHGVQPSSTHASSVQANSICVDRVARFNDRYVAKEVGTGRFSYGRGIQALPNRPNWVQTNATSTAVGATRFGNGPGVQANSSGVARIGRLADKYIAPNVQATTYGQTREVETNSVHAIQAARFGDAHRVQANSTGAVRAARFGSGAPGVQTNTIHANSRVQENPISSVRVVRFKDKYLDSRTARFDYAHGIQGNSSHAYRVQPNSTGVVPTTRLSDTLLAQTNSTRANEIQTNTTGVLRTARFDDARRVRANSTQAYGVQPNVNVTGAIQAAHVVQPNSTDAVESARFDDERFAREARSARFGDVHGVQTSSPHSNQVQAHSVHPVRDARFEEGYMSCPSETVLLGLISLLFVMYLKWFWV